ncbi:MAG: hypothetical protein WAW13_00480 [Minisyncoccia bacterium]
MSWKWDQSAGELSRDGKFVARGYSGAGIGKNNPGLEGRVATGPIPAGRWTIGGPPYNSKNVGPYALYTGMNGASKNSCVVWHNRSVSHNDGEAILHLMADIAADRGITGF